MQALAKEKEKSEGTAASASTTISNETVTSNKVTEQVAADKTVTKTTVKDNVVTSHTVTTEEKVDKVDDDDVKEKQTLASTTQESTTPAITETQEEKVIQPITNSEENSHDKGEIEKGTDAVENISKQDEPVVETSKCLQSVTEAAASVEVSMEMDDLVVHTVDEDDFKIEEQSRAHVSKKSGELPSSTTDEQVSIRLQWVTMVIGLQCRVKLIAHQ